MLHLSMQVFELARSSLCRYPLTTTTRRPMLWPPLAFFDLCLYGFLCCGLMSPPPERPCDDVGGLNSFLRETLGYAADFLDRPTDEVGCLGVALDLVFLGAGLLA